MGRKKTAEQIEKDIEKLKDRLELRKLKEGLKQKGEEYKRKWKK